MNNNYVKKFGALSSVALLTLTATFAPLSTARAQNATATVQVVEGKSNLVFDQRVHCDDYMVLNSKLYTTNAVASQIDIGNDIRLDPWEPTDVVDMNSLRELSPSLYDLGAKYKQGGYSEDQVVLWARTQIAAAIEARTVKHMKDMHKISESDSKQALRDAAVQCARQMGME